MAGKPESSVSISGTGVLKRLYVIMVSDNMFIKRNFVNSVNMWWQSCYYNENKYGYDVSINANPDVVIYPPRFHRKAVLRPKLVQVYI